MNQLFGLQHRSRTDPVILLVVPDADKVTGWGEFSYLLVNNRSQICEYQKIIVSLPQK
jgi:hypothetical protein